MTTRYRVEYALKTHRRDQFIEWIKGLLAVPFVLLSQPTAVFDEGSDVVQMSQDASARYAEIMKDVEKLVQDHIDHHKNHKPGSSKLKLLVPAVGNFFTPLRLTTAFHEQDESRRISSRRFVPPSFNDVRAILNTAQVLSLVKDTGPIELVTFDGDVTLYDDGESLTPDNPAIPCLLRLLRRGVRVGIVTAAGYKEASKYHGRLHGLLEAVHNATELGSRRENLIVMGGESNFLFRYRDDIPERLEWVPRKEWILQEMKTWTEDTIAELLDTAERALRDCVKSMNLNAQILRKDRAVGIIPAVPGYKFPREQLEETVLVTQKILEMSSVGSKIPFCAFNGGNDVFVDIGDKSWGVVVCQRFFGGIEGSKTLHVGDQFLSAGANDFKARLACTTAWIASPAETVSLLDEIERFTVELEHESTNGDNPASLKPTASEFTPRPDQPTSADTKARSLLGTNGTNGTHGTDPATSASAVATPVDDKSATPQGFGSTATSTYAASASGNETSEMTETASIRSDNTTTPRTVMQPRPNGTPPAQKIGNIPTTDQERKDWISKAQGAIGKFSGRYGTPKTGGSDTASVRSGRSGTGSQRNGGGSAFGGSARSQHGGFSEGEQSGGAEPVAETSGWD